MSKTETFADRLLAARKRARLTHHELSLASGIQIQNLRLYEKGRMPSDMEVYEMLAEPLDTTNIFLAFGKIVSVAKS